ncbi:hypothetical protein [Flavobacterium reichenbachii]|nr:hypothetical protein [Flavobacterium reichenbachii]
MSIHTIANADRIMVMKELIIVESGNHLDLLGHKAEYYSLLNKQGLI